MSRALPGALFAVQMRRSARMGRLYAFRIIYLAFVGLPLPIVVMIILGQLAQSGGDPAALAKTGAWWIKYALGVEAVLLLLLTPIHVASQRVLELKNGILDDILLAMGRLNLGHLERYAAQVADFTFLSLVTTPVAGLLLYLGSFPLSRFILFKLTLIACLPLVVSLTNFFAGLAKKTGITVICTYLTLIGLGWYLPTNVMWGTWSQYLPANMNPIAYCFEMLQFGYQGPQWFSLVAITLITGGLIYLLGVFMEYSMGPVAQWWKDLLRPPAKKNKNGLLAGKLPALLNSTPILWKEVLMQRRSFLVSLVLPFIGAVILAYYLHARGDAGEDVRDIMGRFLTPYLVALVAIFSTAAALAREFQSRQMVMFFTAPLEGKSIFFGKLLGASLAPVGVAINGTILLFLLAPTDPLRGLAHLANLLLVALLYGGIALICTLLVKHFFFSILLTIFVCLVLKWHYFFVAMLGMSMMDASNLAPLFHFLDPVAVAGPALAGTTMFGRGSGDAVSLGVAVLATALTGLWTWVALQIMARLFSNSMEGSVRGLR